MLVWAHPGVARGVSFKISFHPSSIEPKASKYETSLTCEMSWQYSNNQMGSGNCALSLGNGQGLRIQVSLLAVNATKVSLVNVIVANLTVVGSLHSKATIEDCQNLGKGLKLLIDAACRHSFSVKGFHLASTHSNSPVSTKDTRRYRGSPPSSS